MQPYYIERIDSSRIVCAEPCLVGGFVQLVKTTGNIDYVVDGFSDDTGTAKFELTGTANQPIVVTFQQPVLFSRGLYVVIAGSEDEITVWYLPTSEIGG